VTLENVTDFVRAGAVAVGVGGSLVDRRALESGNYESIQQSAQKFVSMVQQART
jgi:2-dehydro-3-deoxyphosphogluconate aldolase/(4S)-4-hydroxy-2-oxoglutarate aldolase